MVQCRIDYSPPHSGLSAYGGASLGAGVSNAGFTGAHLADFPDELGSTRATPALIIDGIKTMCYAARRKEGGSAYCLLCSQNGIIQLFELLSLLSRRTLRVRRYGASPLPLASPPVPAEPAGRFRKTKARTFIDPLQSYANPQGGQKKQN